MVEPGSFKDLVQGNGVFASLWADHVGAGAPVPGSSSATLSGVVEASDASIVTAQLIDPRIDEAPAVEASILDSHTCGNCVYSCSVSG